MTPSATSSHLKGYQGQSPWLASITLLSIFLPSEEVFRTMIGRGVERPIVEAKRGAFQGVHGPASRTVRS
jgi:hypothetical protein